MKGIQGTSEYDRMAGVADPFNREFKTEDDQTGQLEDEINRLDGLFSCPKEGNILPGKQPSVGRTGYRKSSCEESGA